MTACSQPHLHTYYYHLLSLYTQTGAGHGSNTTHDRCGYIYLRECERKRERGRKVHLVDKTTIQTNTCVCVCCCVSWCVSRLVGVRANRREILSEKCNNKNKKVNKEVLTRKRKLRKISVYRVADFTCSLAAILTAFLCNTTTYFTNHPTSNYTTQNG